MIYAKKIKLNVIQAKKSYVPRLNVIQGEKLLKCKPC